MAKRRRVKPASGGNHESTAPRDASPEVPDEPTRFDPMSIACGMLGGAVVYVFYYPSDSVAVEKGDALWFAVLALVIATITWAVEAWRGGDSSELPVNGLKDRIADRFLDAGPWLLAAWIMLAAFLSSPPGNLRMATNEAWLWVAGAAIFTSARRLLSAPTARRAILLLLVVGAVALAVHGFHQQFISLPANRAEYQKDPERILELAGIDAPPGSAERMVFENRLFDGGPTGTFALANSLAGVLLIGVVITTGVLRFRWHLLRPSDRTVWILVASLCAGCLLAARSRSATLAMLFGVALVLVFASRKSRTLNWGLGAVAVVGVAVTILIAIFGNREWFEEAPASLAFRFQYWRSTWQMLLDRPLFGAGPGNFQSIYERYRESGANEQIAEPHNFVFETLASGGWVALIILAGIVLAGFIWGAVKDSDRPGTERDAGNVAPVSIPLAGSDRGRWVWLGAVLALGLVWLLGLASRHAPDLQASVFVLPISVAAAFLLARSPLEFCRQETNAIAGAAVCAIALHLTVAGGWTVPGVAVPVWLCAAMLTSSRMNTSDRAEGRPVRVTWVLAFGGTMLAMLHTFSLRPVETRTQLMNMAAMAQSAGQISRASKHLEAAAEADPWSPDALLWLADIYRWQLVLQPDSTEPRRRWESLLVEAKRRAGDDPAMYRMIGAQQLHLYQRHGAKRDLESAAETFRVAHHWSPANQWLAAQMAVVAAERGEQARAEQLALRAWELSRLGGNIERALSRQQIYVARPIGRRAEQGPIRRPASELLPEP